MPNVTVVIPIGPGHEALSERAVASVRSQTVRTEVVTVHDTARRGPGYARNRGLAQVTTPFVVFLDADDWIEPTFVACTLAARKPSRYVYTDWYQDGAVVQAPRVDDKGQMISVPDRKPWCDRTWHAITCLIPTSWAKNVGGFDEQLPGAEDTDFFLKLVTRRDCGQHLSEPLFHYTKNEGSRAHQFNRDAERATATMLTIHERYKGKMGCCGENNTQLPAGEKLPGDVEAVALWGGNRSVMGYATGRMYPRTGNGKVVWVDPRDVAQRPDMWALAHDDEPTVDEPMMLNGVEAVAEALMPRQAPQNYVEYVPPTGARPDVANVLRLAKR